MASESELQEYFAKAEKIVSTVYRAAMQGGEVQAFVRQGFGELGAALKAFPDALQIDEPGRCSTRSIATSPPIGGPSRLGRDMIEPARSLPSPAEIAGGRETGSVYGESRAADRDLPSPGDIARLQPTEQRHDQGRENGQEHGQERGRTM